MAATVYDPMDVAAWIRAAAPNGRPTSDSRRVRAGDVFFAYPGRAVDGRAFIGAAIERGAAAVVYDPAGFDRKSLAQASDKLDGIPHLAVPDLKQNAGPIAHACHGMPDAGMFTVGVTGTNGKTSCALWTAWALAHLGETAGVIGTLGVGLVKGDAEPEFDATGYTTPDAVLLAGELATLRGAGAGALAIEVSSIGLVEARAAGMHFDVAVFTNLTRDHLDYHGDMAAYEAAKLKLFDWPGLKHAVVNLDDDAGLRIVAHLRARCLQGGADVRVTGYTLRAEAERPAIDGVGILRARDVRSTAGGTAFDVDTPAGSAHAETALVGRFNASNALAVLGALLAKGVALDAALGAIATLAPAPGRMQQLGGALGDHGAPLVVIDYAHTPDALDKTLAALRQVARERGGALWCVFGCGGDRDPGKRPQMGRIAQDADHAVVTSDNPRSEAPGAIIAQIEAGMDAARIGAQDTSIEDRAAAIAYAVTRAAAADVILLAGKGHEPYQEIQGRKLPFSDADQAAQALNARRPTMEIAR